LQVDPINRVIVEQKYPADVLNRNLVGKKKLDHPAFTASSELPKAPTKGEFFNHDAACQTLYPTSPYLPCHSSRLNPKRDVSKMDPGSVIARSLFSATPTKPSTPIRNYFPNPAIPADLEIPNDKS